MLVQPVPEQSSTQSLISVAVCIHWKLNDYFQLGVKSMKSSHWGAMNNDACDYSTTKSINIYWAPSDFLFATLTKRAYRYFNKTKFIFCCCSKINAIHRWDCFHFILAVGIIVGLKFTNHRTWFRTAYMSRHSISEWPRQFRIVAKMTSNMSRSHSYKNAQKPVTIEAQSIFHS